MEPEIATAVAVGIAIVNFVIWLFAFQAMLRATRERQALSAAADEQLIGTEERSTTIIAGSAEVPGGPDELAVKLAERLARDGLGSLGPIKITAANRTEVTFEAIGNPQGGSGLRRGSVRFSGRQQHAHRLLGRRPLRPRTVRTRLVLRRTRTRRDRGRPHLGIHLCDQ